MRNAKASTAERRTLRRNIARPLRRSSEPRDWSRAKLIVVGAFFGLLWLALWARAFYVQVLDGKRLAQMASRQHYVSESVTGRRGQILDRDGAVLAKSVLFKSVCANPLEVEKPAEIALKLAPMLGVDSVDLLRQLTAKTSFVWLARKVGDKVAAKVEEARFPGVHLSSEFGRQYPNRRLAGQLLGFVGLDDEGLEGLEKSFDDRLAGGVSKFVVHRDAAGHKLYLDAEGNEVAVEGEDLRLTIDRRLQYSAEEILAATAKQFKANWAGAVLVEVGSGEILAWAQYPFFNPNDWSRYDASTWRNRLAMDAFEPGSTFKSFVVAAALQEGVVTPEKQYFCENGRCKFGRITIRDTHSYGDLTVSGIISHSSNIGAAKIGLELGARRYYDYLARLGFGERTSLPLPGQSRGILRSPGEWREIDLASASFGQSVSVTMAQLAEGFLCLANGGVRKPLTLVRDETRPAGAETRVFDANTAREVLNMMTEVIEGDGTGRAVRIQGLRMAGKTGTAQKASAAGGYGDKYMASFVGMFPAERPEYLILVVVDDPKPNHYGAVVAAPAYRELALSTLAAYGGLPEEGKPLLAEEGANAHAAESIAEDLVAGWRRKSNPLDAERVPDLVGSPIRKAMEVLMGLGVVPSLRGEGLVVARQSPEPGGAWPNAADPNVVLWLEPGYGG